MTGKSTFTDLQRDLYGSNSTTADIDRIMQNFNKILQGKLVVVVEETRDERGKSENKIKDLVTNKSLIIEGKGKDTFEALSFSKFFFNSNYPEDFLKIKDNEDRFMVFKVPPVPKNKLNNKLLDEMRAQLGHWRWFLEHRAITHPDKGRLWFETKDYETAALQAVKDRSQSYTFANIKELLRYIFSNAQLNQKHLLEIKLTSNLLAEYMNAFYDTRGKWQSRSITNELQRESIKSTKYSTRFKYPSINLFNKYDKLVVEEKTIAGRYYTFKVKDYLTKEEVKALYGNDIFHNLYEPQLNLDKDLPWNNQKQTNL